MRIHRFDACLGAEVLDIDLRQPPDEATFSMLARTFADNGVLVLRGQSIDEAQHAAFARRFGELEIMKVYTEFISPRQPEIFVVSNIVENGRPIGLQDAGQTWHTDGSFRPEPPMGSLLLAIELPAKDGRTVGDTLFASTSAAFEALDANLRHKLLGLRAVHRLNDGRSAQASVTAEGRVALTEEQKRSVREVTHPIVRTHPVTGRACLYVNPLFTSHIVGLAAAESAKLLAALYAHIARPEFVYRHNWQPGDLLMWDNCSTQHNAIGDYALPLRRRMHRATIKGSVPIDAGRERAEVAHGRA